MNFRSLRLPIICAVLIALLFGGLLASNAIDGVFPSVVALLIVIFASFFLGMAVQEKFPNDADE